MKTSYTELMERAERIRWMMLDRINKVGKQAGLGGSGCIHLAHNAIVAQRAGFPWKHVDYTLVRKVLWLSVRMSKPYDLVRQYTKKV